MFWLAVQAQQVDQVLRKMQEREMKRRSLTPIKSPLSGPITPGAGPTLMSLDSGSSDSSAEKRKADGDSPDSPDTKKATTIKTTHTASFAVATRPPS